MENNENKIEYDTFEDELFDVMHTANGSAFLDDRMKEEMKKLMSKGKNMSDKLMEGLWYAIDRKYLPEENSIEIVKKTCEHFAERFKQEQAKDHWTEIIDKMTRQYKLSADDSFALERIVVGNLPYYTPSRKPTGKCCAVRWQQRRERRVTLWKKRRERKHLWSGLKQTECAE